MVGRQAVLGRGRPLHVQAAEDATPVSTCNAVWSVLSSVTQQGDKIVFTFKSSAVPYFYYVAGQTPIVPQHIWASIKDPVTYKDSTPLGTGPFTMSSCSPQVIKYQKNA